MRLQNTASGFGKRGNLPQKVKFLHLRYVYSTWIPAHFLVDPLPTQLPTNVLGQTAAHDQSAQAPTTHRKTEKELLSPVWLCPDPSLVLKPCVTEEIRKTIP